MRKILRIRILTEKLVISKLQQARYSNSLYRTCKFIFNTRLVWENFSQEDTTRIGLLLQFSFVTFVDILTCNEEVSAPHSRKI